MEACQNKKSRSGSKSSTTLGTPKSGAGEEKERPKKWGGGNVSPTKAMLKCMKRPAMSKEEWGLSADPQVDFDQYVADHGVSGDAVCSRSADKKNRYVLREEYVENMEENGVPVEPWSAKSISSKASFEEMDIKLSKQMSRILDIPTSPATSPSKPCAEKGGTRKPWTQILVTSRPFQGVVYATICANSIQMGLAIDYPQWSNIWVLSEYIFSSIFFIEMVLKLIAYKKAYFEDSWNRMDCTLVCLSLVDVLIITIIMKGEGTQMRQLTILRILRVCRVIRIARVFKVFKELWVILKGILDSLRVIFWVILLLVLTLYVCSILCVDMMGRKDHGGVILYPGFDDDEENIEAARAVAQWNNYVYFGSISRSMYTLFNVVILTEFSEFGRAMIEKQPEMAIFFVFFVVFTTFGILNVIIGVIVDNTMEAAKQMDDENEKQKKQEKLRLLDQIREIVFALDTDESGTICAHKIEEGWKLPALQQVLKEMRLPAAFSAQEFMFLLDGDGDGELSFEEFLTNCYRVVLNDAFQMNCCLHASLNEVKTKVNNLERENHRTRAENKAELKQNKAEIKQLKDIMLSIKSSLEASGTVQTGKASTPKLSIKSSLEASGTMQTSKASTPKFRDSRPGALSIPLRKFSGDQVVTQIPGGRSASVQDGGCSTVTTACSPSPNASAQDGGGSTGTTAWSPSPSPGHGPTSINPQATPQGTNGPPGYGSTSINPQGTPQGNNGPPSAIIKASPPETNVPGIAQKSIDEIQVSIGSPCEQAVKEESFEDEFRAGFTRRSSVKSAWKPPRMSSEDELLDDSWEDVPVVKVPKSEKEATRHPKLVSTLQPKSQKLEERAPQNSSLGTGTPSEDPGKFSPTKRLLEQEVLLSLSNASPTLSKTTLKDKKEDAITNAPSTDHQSPNTNAPSTDLRSLDIEILADEAQEQESEQGVKPVMHVTVETLSVSGRGSPEAENAPGCQGEEIDVSTVMGA